MQRLLKVSSRTTVQFVLHQSNWIAWNQCRSKQFFCRKTLNVYVVLASRRHGGVDAAKKQLGGRGQSSSQVVWCTEKYVSLYSEANIGRDALPGFERLTGLPSKLRSFALSFDAAEYRAAMPRVHIRSGDTVVTVATNEQKKRHLSRSNSVLCSWAPGRRFTFPTRSQFPVTAASRESIFHLQVLRVLSSHRADAWRHATSPVSWLLQANSVVWCFV